MKGLCESTRGVWSGDIDLNDGELDKLFQSMQKRLAFIQSLGLKERREVNVLIADLEVLLENSSDDKDFVLKSKG